MYAFQYQRPASLDEAAALLAKPDGGKALAGGQSLLASMKLRLASPGELVDLGGLTGLRGVELKGSELVVGAMTTHAEVAASKAVREALPALAALAAGIGDRQVRAMGTLGGSIANNDPAADYPAAVLGLGATVVTNKRRIAADDFFRGLYETALEAGELVVSVSFPLPKRAAYVKFQQPASRFALVGVMVSQAAGGAVRVAVTGAGSSVFRVAEMERALSANFAPAAIGGIRVAADALNSDLHASAEYRAHLVGVLAQRAVAAALG